MKLPIVKVLIHHGYGLWGSLKSSDLGIESHLIQVTIHNFSLLVRNFILPYFFIFFKLRGCTNDVYNLNCNDINVITLLQEKYDN